MLCNIRRSTKYASIIAPLLFKSLINPIPVWSMLYLTRKCNLDCQYCFVKDNNRKELSTSEFKRVIDRLKYLNVGIVAFFGGEPTLRKDLSELVAYANKKNLITHLSTNGTLLTEKLVDELGSAGLGYFNVSLDSVIEYDYSKKNYGMQKKALDMLIRKKKKYGYDIMTGIVLSPKNHSSIPNLVKSLSSYGVSSAITLPTGNTYSHKKINEKIFFAEKERISLFKTLVKLKKMKRDGFKLLEPLQYYEDIPKHFEDNNFEWYCAAGEYMFSVDCDGKFMICSGLPPEKESIFDVDRDFYLKFKARREKALKSCKTKCFGSCGYTSSYLIKHPYTLITDKI